MREMGLMKNRACRIRQEKERPAVCWKSLDKFLTQ